MNLELAEGAEQTRAKRLDLAVLAAEPELHGEPVARGQVVDLLIRCSKRGQPDFLRKVGKVLVGKEWHVAHELVHCVRLGRIHGHGRVSQILRRVEDAEGQAGEEIAW